MVQENNELRGVPDRKFAHYKPTTGELLSAFFYYSLTDADNNGVFGNMPSDQQLLTDGIKTAIVDIPELQSLIDANGELSSEARMQLDKLKAEGILVEKDGKYELGDKQKIDDTFGSLPTIMFTPDGISILKGVAATAKSFWSPQKPQDSGV